ncbi:hypothetical protein M3689_06375 [Alkalihalophilus marmarensis]|jgi:spore coat protein W|uniref:Spore coat protein W n=1 Tax=Alkalihalophilus marmarensis DSM 21297 TaxID=1188261 RepID=U6SR34_9BACI|nr:hypothetical protein [Alkalihalophilus marmarensis]ERN53121.1 hypothetical protein A33I_13290 [Alkalihalophilus marmarensis DSM 21297]MCM3488933.1 hypothetical protein [Alkalihalophilus marmarensis]
MGKHQRDLINLMVKNVLKKHQADLNLDNISSEQKREIRAMVENIQAEVEQFLDKKK